MGRWQPPSSLRRPSTGTSRCSSSSCRCRGAAASSCCQHHCRTDAFLAVQLLTGGGKDAACDLCDERQVVTVMLELDDTKDVSAPPPAPALQMCCREGDGVVSRAWSWRATLSATTSAPSKSHAVRPPSLPFLSLCFPSLCRSSKWQGGRRGVLRMGVGAGAGVNLCTRLLDAIQSSTKFPCE
eukprot:1858084-Rhodomonas_salina.1